MRVHSFIGKANMEGVQKLDEHINDWMSRNNVQPVHVTQSCGFERHHGRGDEPVVIVTVWYETGD